MIVRSRFTSTDIPDQHFYFDLMLDDQNMPIPDHPYFGFLGTLSRTDEGDSVILLSDGIIDLGDAYIYDSRYWKTNLRQREIVVGHYITVWEKLDGQTDETTYRIDSIIELSAMKVGHKIPEQVWEQKPTTIPQFRARTIKPIEIRGYDDRIYRPPVGTTGYLARVANQVVFYPDNAMSKNGHMIDVSLAGDEVELIATEE